MSKEDKKGILFIIITIIFGLLGIVICGIVTERIPTEGPRIFILGSLLYAASMSVIYAIMNHKK